MLGLIVLFAFFVYLLIAILVVLAVARLAREQGRSPRGWAAAIVMYLLVFWDHLPTLLLHKYYCATKAGFWVYKTPEQWKAENPGVAETLTWRDRSPPFGHKDVVYRRKLNERFVWEHRRLPAPVLPVRIGTEAIVDTTSGDVMVRRVGVESGYGELAIGSPTGDWRVIKFWVGTEACVPNIHEFGQFREVFKQLGRKHK